MAKKKAGKTAPKKTAKPAKKATKTAAPAKKAAAVTTTSKLRKAIAPKNKGSQSYTLSEVYENIKGFCGLVKRSEAKNVCEDIAAFVTESLAKGYKIPMFGLGKMYVRRTKPRVGRNPATGQEIQIPAKKRVRFTVSKSLKDAVL